MIDSSSSSSSAALRVAFIGGGNMASAILGGLIKQGMTAAALQVVEPVAEQRKALAAQFGVATLETPQASLSHADLVVWAVKPQSFKAAAAQAKPYTAAALHLSVAAGIRTDSLVKWLGTERVVRAMPNTPALIGQGMTALFARPAVSAADQQAVTTVMQPTGDLLWLDGDESQLDAVTALSGSGPAYVFYFLEAMTAAGVAMGLPSAAAHRLALRTFTGASALADASEEAPAVLRARVTSKGGTTDAALRYLDSAGVGVRFIEAMQAAQQRAAALGDEFGAD